MSFSEVPDRGREMAVLAIFYRKCRWNKYRAV
jgi:hypothetical protein